MSSTGDIAMNKIAVPLEVFALLKFILHSWSTIQICREMMLILNSWNLFTGEKLHTLTISYRFGKELWGWGRWSVYKLRAAEWSSGSSTRLFQPEGKQGWTTVRTQQNGSGKVFGANSCKAGAVVVHMDAVGAVAGLTQGVPSSDSLWRFLWPLNRQLQAWACSSQKSRLEIQTWTTLLSGDLMHGNTSGTNCRHRRV